MLAHPGIQLVPHVLPAVAEKYQAVCVQAEPLITDLSDYHRLPPAARIQGIRGDLGHDSLGAALGLVCTIVGAA